jgi:hypothetical protein
LRERKEIVMGSILVKIEDASLAALSELAIAHNHSLELEIHEVLETAVAERLKRLEFFRRAQEISALTPKDRVQTDSTLIIREERDR